jgi:hypothetical protein
MKKEIKDENRRVRCKSEGMKTSKLMSRTLGKMGKASALIYETKTKLKEMAIMTEEIKNERGFHFEPICKQGELFPCLENLPEDNEALARLCLGSLVETL